MQLIIKARQLGRKHALIEHKIIDIEDIGLQPTVRLLLQAVAAQQVSEYNNKQAGDNLVPFLSSEEVSLQAESGKVDFKTIYHNQRVSVPVAQQTVLQAFEDGMFALFCNDEALTTLDQTIPITRDSVITFVRLTFLAGSYW